MPRLRPRSTLALYTLLSFFFTWPLLPNITTHVPGDGIDDPSLAWNLWWINERLVRQVNWDIFHVAWMFHPIQINLGFYTLTPLNGLLSVPLQSATSLIIANNLLLLSSFILGGFGTYLLTRQELRFMVYASRITHRSTWLTASHAAFLAGIIYAFASAKLFYVALGQFNIASSQWIPFCALYLLRLARSTTVRTAIPNALLAALFLTLQAWAELTYASFLIIFALFVFGWSLASAGSATGSADVVSQSATSNRITQHAARSSAYASRFTPYVLPITAFALLALTFLIGIAPFLWAMIPDLLVEGNFFGSGGGFADQYSADLAGYLLPTQLHPFFGSWVEQLPFPHDKAQQIFIGYTTVGLMLVGVLALLRKRATRLWGSFWPTITLFFWWLTLGAEVRWLGQGTGIPGPFALISQLPFFSGNRYPSRYSVMLLLGVAVLAGAGSAWLMQLVGSAGWKTRRPDDQTTRREKAGKAQRITQHAARSTFFLCVLFLLFTLEQLSIPLPLSDFRTPAIYERLAMLPGDFTLLELPTGWRNGARVMGKSDLLIMLQEWYQTTHGKRRLGGNTSRNPLYKFQYFINAPLVGDLIALMNANPATDPAQDEIARVVEATFDELVARDRPLAGEVLDFLNVDYVTVHVEKASPALLRFIDEVLPLTQVDRWEGLDWSGAPSTILLYQVSLQQRPPTWTIDLTAPTSSLYLAEGWSPLPWQGTRYATRPCATLLLDLPEVAGQLVLELSDSPQAVTVTLNGQPLPPLPTTGADARQTLTLPITEGLATAPIDRVTLCTPQASPLSAFAAPQGWPIGKTGATSAVPLLVQSAGNDVGNFAQIWREGVPLLTAATGYNLVALAADGTRLATAHFNTLASATESDALATWLYQWPPGTIIAGAIMDEASTQLNQRAIDALATLGVSTDLRGHFRWSHTFVGLVGAPAGSALEAAALLRPATVAVGTPADAPAVYVGVRRIHYQP